MAQIVSTVCDECEKVKGTTNHWWLMGMTNSGELVIKQAEKKESNCGAFVSKWDLCGADCATKVFSRFLSVGKLEKESTVESK
jgi:hypothetical protein